MPQSAAPGELHDALDRLFGNGQRINGCPVLNYQIFSQRNQQADIKQLSLGIEMSDANAFDPDRTVNQLLALRHWQLGRLQRQPALSCRQFDEVVGILLVEANRADDTADLHKLAILLATRQLLKGNRLRLRKLRRSQDANAVR